MIVHHFTEWPVFLKTIIQGHL